MSASTLALDPAAAGGAAPPATVVDPAAVDPVGAAPAAGAGAAPLDGAASLDALPPLEFNGELESLDNFPLLARATPEERASFHSAYQKKLNGLTAVMTRATQQAAAEKAAAKAEMDASRSTYEEQLDAVADVKEKLIAAMASDDGASALIEENRSYEAKVRELTAALTAAKAEAEVNGHKHAALKAAFDSSVEELRTDITAVMNKRLESVSSELSEARKVNEQLAAFKEAQDARFAEEQLVQAINHTKSVLPWITDDATAEEATQFHARIAELELARLERQGLRESDLTSEQIATANARLAAQLRAVYPDPKTGVRVGSAADELAGGAEVPAKIDPLKAPTGDSVRYQRPFANTVPMG